MSKGQSKQELATSYIIGGGAVLGSGIGFLVNNLVGFALAGVGLGLLISAFIVLRSNRNS